MKRFLCLALATVLSLVSFVSCDEGNDGASEKTSYVVEQSAWERAFTGENYENVTICYYYDDADQTDPEIVKVDEANGLLYSTGSSGGASSDGTSHHTEYENWFYQKDGLSYVRTKAITTYQPSGEVEVKWTDESNEYEVSKEQVGAILNSLEWTFSDEELYLSSQFANFTYNEETKVYEGTITERIEREDGYDDLVYHHHVTVAFENEKLTSVKYYSVFENEDTVSELHSYYLTDYGTTVITLPELPNE